MDNSDGRFRKTEFERLNRLRCRIQCDRLGRTYTWNDERLLSFGRLVELVEQQHLKQQNL